jgi:hypothetical protein
VSSTTSADVLRGGRDRGLDFEVEIDDGRPGELVTDEQRFSPGGQEPPLQRVQVHLGGHGDPAGRPPRPRGWRSP